MCPVIRSKPLHSETKDVFLVREADRSPPIESPEHVDRGDGSERGHDLYLAAIDIGAQVAGEKGIHSYHFP